ncbi:MAG: AtpZ/AtpI family protein [Lachnospiraceae bacterium]|nr:AtpZ/AtpI family protein [Lachnospiraceae bacterium]
MKKNSNEIVRSLALITQLGVSMLAPVVLCAVVGNWLDERYGWSVTAVFLILGIMAGARNTWILVKNVIKPDEKGRLDNEKENK